MQRGQRYMKSSSSTLELKRSHHSGNVSTWNLGISCWPLHLDTNNKYLLSICVRDFQERQSLKLVPKGHHNRYHNLRPYFKSLVSLLEWLFLRMKYWFWVVQSTIFLGCFLSIQGIPPEAEEYGTHTTVIWRSSRKTPVPKEYSRSHPTLYSFRIPGSNIITWPLKQEDSDLFLLRFYEHHGNLKTPKCCILLASYISSWWFPINYFR